MRRSFAWTKLIDATKTQRDQVEEQLKDMENQLAKVDSDAKEVVAGRNDDQDRVFPDNRPTRKTKGRLIAAVIVLIATASIIALVALIGPASPRIQVSYYYRPAGQDELRTLPPGSELRSGDHYKIWFTAEQDSYVYLFYIDSNQDIYRLFPRESLQGVALDQTNPVKAGRQYQLPADDKAFVLPDDRLGQEKIYVLAFQEPNPALEQLYDALEQARQQQNTTRIADLQNLLLAKLQKAPAVPAFTFVHLEKK